MTQQMKRLTTRVDGTSAAVAPVSIPPAPLGAPATAEELRRSSRAARLRVRRAARTGGWVPTARVPRAVATVAFVEPSDMHSDLLAAGLL